jgi:3D (Asp-Asp-Asp) domain-containing protein
MKSWRKLGATMMAATLSFSTVNGADMPVQNKPAAALENHQTLRTTGQHTRNEANDRAALNPKLLSEPVELKKSDVIKKKGIVASSIDNKKVKPEKKIKKQELSNQKPSRVPAKSLPSRKRDKPRETTLKMTATAYTISIEDTGKLDGITYTETKAKEGRTVAVDPKVIPLGSTLYIEFENRDGKTVNGYYVAEDIGGAIKGKKIDIFFDTKDEAIEFGRRSVNVTIVKKGTWKRGHK